MPHTDDDQAEEHNRTVFAKDVEQDLQHWLSHLTVHCSLKVLDRE